MKRLIIMSLLFALGVPAFLHAQQSDRSIITGADEFTSHKSFSSVFEAYTKLSCSSDDYTVVRFTKLGEPDKYNASSDAFDSGLKNMIGKAETGDIYHIMNFQPLTCNSITARRKAPEKLVIYIR